MPKIGIAKSQFRTLALFPPARTSIYNNNLAPQ